MGNHLSLAVAGSGKTRSIVEYCSGVPIDQRVLVLTYTRANQAELCRRISRKAGKHHGIDVMGWFTFLLRHFARPFLPCKFPGHRVLGFNFDGRPHRMTKGLSRFLDINSAAYASELGRLASELIEDSAGALMRRMQCIYREILIDEVQDLSSHDWEIVDYLLRSRINIRMVGDIRQAVLSTNPRSSKNKRYSYADAIHWFREREAKGLLEITENNKTWRCVQGIAQFADSIFDSTWGFPVTESMNHDMSGHDGVFLVKPSDVERYIETFQPLCLRSTANSGKDFDLDYVNFRVAKGTQSNRVLIVPTSGIREFIQKGKFLAPIPAASFYVATTRAKQSAAIVIAEPGISTLPFWDAE